MQLNAQVDREEALAFLGHAGQTLDDSMTERLERAAQLCENELRPRGTWCVLPTNQALALLPGRDIARHVEGCTEVVLMAVTLGAESEQMLRRERALSPTDGLLVDACASSLVEQAANGLNAVVREQAAARDMAVTSRFSPGYGDLPLSCQPAFLNACGAGKTLGLHVTSANLLVPTKSITAVIGLKPAVTTEKSAASSSDGAFDASAFDNAQAVAPDDVASVDPRCDVCSLATTCALRAQGRTCHGTFT